GGGGGSAEEEGEGADEGAEYAERDRGHRAEEGEQGDTQVVPQVGGVDRSSGRPQQRPLGRLHPREPAGGVQPALVQRLAQRAHLLLQRSGRPLDRKSTRLNSSHVKISYAVFCL